ncbi:hypothetical protein OS493_036004 [Desmophyllum pertusum]|uniref:Uncharacterized protein n=1 Tax=Desmophyllum pertusum TaxID=174260 RepID=A0A9W9ZVN9_9CNID|nr:hypothetical protein OS493_036004 [Desmophyllum pertusum]
MGSCNSVMCSESKIEKVVKIEKQEETCEEIEETPVVAIHINCPSNTGSWRAQLEPDRDTGSAAAVSSSLEVLVIESNDQTLSDTSPFLPEDECDVTQPQDVEEDFCLEIRGKSCMPRNVKITGLGQEDDVPSRGLAQVENTACSSLRNDGQLQREELPGSSGLHSTPNISLPPPRPSPWQQVYSKVLKKREQLAEENLKKKKPRRSPKKKSFNLEDEIRARNVRIIKQIKKAARSKAAQGPNSDAVALPPDEAIARIFGVDVEDFRDSSSNNSFSSSHASTRSSSAASRDSSITLDEDLEDAALDSANNKQKGAKKSRKWFRLKHNKVAPL